MHLSRADKKSLLSGIGTEIKRRRHKPAESHLAPIARARIQAQRDLCRDF
jgi:hypothetical protein